jgi:hypothetical protein
MERKEEPYMADLDLVESFFQSIDTIVNKRIEVLPYDKTI